MGFIERTNASTLFLLPGIGLSDIQLKKYGFISAYVDDANHDIKYESSVFLLFKPKNLETLQYFISKEYKRTTLLKEDYDYDGGYVVMAYSFNKDYYEDYEKFLVGEYSKFSAKYKALFPSYESVRLDGVIKQVNTLSYRVFNKVESFKLYIEREIGMVLPSEAELWGSPYLDSKDLLDIKLIQQNESNLHSSEL